MLYLAMGMMFAVVIDIVIWQKLVPARCPDCGNRCQLVKENDAVELHGRKYPLMRYRCPKCKYQL